jgi:vacuolar-type H+-ATPase subunit H
LNEKSILQVLELEKEAQAIYEAAIREAQQLPVDAEKEAQALMDKTRVDAQAEAQQLIAKARSEEETAQILAQAKKKVQQFETLASGNLDHAVNYVIARVVGKG